MCAQIQNTKIPEYLSTYKKLYKIYFVKQQLEALFLDIHYNRNGGLKKSILDESGLIDTGDLYRSNDLIEAKYKDIHFSQSDVEIIKKHKEIKDDKTHETQTTIFRGCFMMFEFPKKFSSKMAISFDGHGESYINLKTGRGMDRIQTESTEFNKRFLVYAEDHFEALYILDPAFIDRLEKLGDEYNNQLEFYFSDNKLYIGFNNNDDLFEPPSANIPIDEQTEKDKAIKSMRLVIDLIDELRIVGH